MKHFRFYAFTVTIALLSIGCESKKESAPATTEIPAAVKKEAPAEPAVAKKVKEAGQEFFDAAFQGNLKHIESELAAGVPVDARTADNQTALMLAAFNGHTNLVEMLISYGGDVNALDGTNRSALMYASSGPFPKTVQLLLDKGAQINTIDNNEKWTALMFAAAEGQAENVEILLKNGADVTLADIDGETAADFALQKGHAKIAEIINNYPSKSTE